MESLQSNLLIILLCTMTVGITACNGPMSGNVVKSIPEVKILDEIDVDSVVADFPVRFSFLTIGDHQFIGYFNKERMLTVASRKRADRKWTYKVLPSKVGWDSHNSITMALDRDSCLHLSGNMHNDTLLYFKTQRPLDINTFEKIFPIVAPLDELRSTYPKFVKNAEGALIFSYRKGGSGNGITLTSIYDESSKSFARLTSQPLFDGLGQMSAYAKGPVLGPDSLFHLIWYWRDTPGCETNHHLSYVSSPDLVNYNTTNGKKIELPITPLDLQATVDSVPSKGGAINGGAVLFFNKEKQPIIAHMKYDSIGISQIFLATKINERWMSKQISKWDYRWAFSGSGSINFEIRVNQGYVNKEGRIAIPYYHIKKGYGELIIDEKSLSLLEDRSMANHESKDYPYELLEPTLNVDSMAVNWLRPYTPRSGTNDYYALRWETMGKRRFYKPRKNEIKPSVMKLFHMVKD